MSNKKWNYLTIGSILYVIIVGFSIKFLYDNDSTRHIGALFVSDWGLPRIIYGITILIAIYLVMLRVVRDSEPNKQVTRKTFVKAVFATIGMFLFVMGAQSLRS